MVWVQNMLTSVSGAVVPLTQLQSELYSFLLGLAGVVPVEDGLGGIDGAGLSAAVDASVASQLRLVLLLAGVPGMPVAGNTGAATLGGIAASIFGATSEVGRASSLPGMAPPAPNGAIPMGVRSFLRHALCDLPGSRFTGGAGRCRSARRRRACDPYPGRGARRIPPGQSRFRIADSGHRALRPSGAVRCRPFGVIGCRPSEGIARRPSGGVKRRMSSRSRLAAGSPGIRLSTRWRTPGWRGPPMRRPGCGILEKMGRAA